MEKEMNWDNLHNCKCPKCGLKLKFRLSGSKNKIRARLGSPLKDNEDYYFCFKCNFQITGSKLGLLTLKRNKDIEELTKDCKYL